MGTARNDDAQRAPTSVPASLPPAAREHSWRANPGWTAVSLLLCALFFLQTHEWRVGAWSQLRSLIKDERLFLLAAGVLMHGLVFTGSNLAMLAIYAAELPFFEHFKIQASAWPWRRGAKERADYFALIRRSVLLVAFNQYVLTPFMLWTSYDLMRARGMSGDVSSVPHWYTSLWQIGVAMLVEDCLFYWAHRTLHHPKLYGPIHKLHHQYKSSIGLASEYAHPIEFIFSNALPFTAGPLLVGMHYWTFLMWNALRVGETVDGHSGYEFPWSPFRLLPFSGSSTGHEYHHWANIGNYGSFFTFWDRLMGTDQAFLRWEQKQLTAKLAEEKNLLAKEPPAAARAGADSDSTDASTEVQRRRSTRAAVAAHDSKPVE